MSVALQALGWKPLGKCEVEVAKRNPKLVLVYPHTSNWDLYLCMLYKFSNSMLQGRMRFLVGGYCMRGWQGNLLRRYGAIQCSYREVRSAGSTASIVAELKKMEEFILLISPKGTLEAASWRSGYYQIAKQTGARIVCGGLDYYSHCFKFSEPFDIGDNSLEEVEFRCKKELSSIAPHYPWMVEYPISLHQVMVPTSVMRSERYHLLIFALISLLLLVLLLHFNRRKV